METKEIPYHDDTNLCTFSMFVSLQVLLILQVTQKCQDCGLRSAHEHLRMHGMKMFADLLTANGTAYLKIAAVLEGEQLSEACE